MQNAEEAAEIKKRRTFRKFTYRGIELDKYVLPIFTCRNRWRPTQREEELVHNP